MDVPPKSLIFLWQTLHNALPIRGNLLRRDIRVNAACSFCADDIESNDHLFWECPFTQKLWTLASHHSWLPLHQMIRGPQCVTQLILHLHHNRTSMDMVKATFLLWQLWKARNATIFRQDVFCPLRTLIRAKREFAEWKIRTRLSEDPF